MSLRCIEECSSDGLRKVVIEAGVDSSSISLFMNDDCIITIKVKENIFDLTKAKLKNRKYLIFAEKFLEKGLEDDTMQSIEDNLNSGTRRVSRCSVNFHFTNGLSCEGSSINLCLHGNRIQADWYYGKDRKLSDLLSMSTEDLFNAGKSWGVIKYNSHSNLKDIFGNNLCSFTYNNIDFYGYREMIEGFKNIDYLKKVDYFHTGSIFKMDTFSEKDKKNFAKASMFDKKILLLYLRDDLIPVYEIL